MVGFTRCSICLAAPGSRKSPAPSALCPHRESARPAATADTTATPTLPALSTRKTSAASSTTVATSSSGCTCGSTSSCDGAGLSRPLTRPNPVCPSCPASPTPCFRPLPPTRSFNTRTLTSEQISEQLPTFVPPKQKEKVRTDGNHPPPSPVHLPAGDEQSRNPSVKVDPRVQLRPRIGFIISTSATPPPPL